MGQSETLISTPDELRDLCQQLAQAQIIAFDTEFIPERTYTPQLCLIQVASENAVTAIDPLAVEDVTCFWECLVTTGAPVIVHAGKHEMEFCVAATGKLPKQLVDVQIAAGFVGLGHPTSYTNLVARLLGHQVQSGETRTDWSQRPLSTRQIKYALDDVRYLAEIWRNISDLLDKRGRRRWYEIELEETFAPLTADPSARVRRVSGAGGLGPRGLAVMREIVLWREERARSLNRPPRWVLRDDIIGELAKRQPATLEELRSTRGLGLDTKAAWARDLLAAIQRGLDIPDDLLPRPSSRRETADEQMVIKILAAAMIQRGRELGIATGLIGSNEDLRDVLDWYRLGKPDDEKPSLLLGWRGDVAGKYLLDLLSGNVVARIAVAKDDVELHFEPTDRPSPTREK